MDRRDSARDRACENDAEGRPPFGPLVEAKRVVDGVAGLVAEVPHRLGVVFDAARHLAFDALETGVSQIERHADERRPIRAAPLIAQIDGRPKGDAASVELAIELGRESLDTRAFDGEADIGDALAEQGISARRTRGRSCRVRGQGAYPRGRLELRRRKTAVSFQCQQWTAD